MCSNRFGRTSHCHLSRSFCELFINRPFTIVTDHKAMNFLDSSKTTNGRLARLALRLQPVMFSIKYNLDIPIATWTGCHQVWPAPLSTPVSSDGLQPPDEMKVSCFRTGHEQLTKQLCVCGFHYITIDSPL